jgi:hypothetical protein
MMLKALIVEQLEADGTIRSFKMQPSQNGRDLVVAFPDEYEERRVGPFSDRPGQILQLRLPRS